MAMNILQLGRNVQLIFMAINNINPKYENALKIHEDERTKQQTEIDKRRRIVEQRSE